MRVRDYECDLQGIVNNAVYQHYTEHCRNEFMRQRLIGLETLHERGIGLRKAYERAQKADRMKTAVLHNMTNQMMVPATTIANDVSTLCDNYESISQEEADRIVTEIQAQGKSITILLKNLLSSSDENKGKEEEYA